MLPCPRLIKAVYLSFLLSQRRFFILLFLFILSALFLSVSLTYASPQSDQLIQLINSERQKQNLPSLHESDTLTQAAHNHDTTMLSCLSDHDLASCFTHQVNVTSEPALPDRVKQVGYTYSFAAENIAWGYQQSDEVDSAWMGSPGHKDNILSAQASEIGCAVTDTSDSSRTFWTCDFGKPLQSSVLTPSVTPPVTSSLPALPLRKTHSRTPVTVTPTPTPLPTLTPEPTVYVVPELVLPNIPWWCAFVPIPSFCHK